MVEHIPNQIFEAIVRSQCGFADIDSWLNGLMPWLPRASPTKGELHSALERAAEEMQSKGPIVDDSKAWAVLAADDVRDLLVNLVEDSWTFESRSLTEKLLAAYSDVGLQVESREVEVVDRFPSPFENAKWSAFCPDTSDIQRFRLQRKLYFRRDRLRPYFSEALLAHELVHIVPGDVDPEVLAMGLEEGIADVFGSLYGASKLMSPTIARRLFTYGRLSPRREHLWTLYLDHGRQAALLYQRFGLGGLAALLHDGRHRIQEVEEALVGGELDGLQISPGHWDPSTTKLVESLYSGYLPNYVVGPLAYLLLGHIRVERTLSEVCSAANVPEHVGIPALQAVASRTNLFILDGTTVAYSNVAHYLSMRSEIGVPVIRYDIPSLGSN